MKLSIPVKPTQSDQRLRLVLSGILLMALAGGSAWASEGSFRHGFVMRGQILELDARNVVVCVGKQDGAKPGQVLDVVRHVRVGAPGKSAGPQFRRDQVGTVKITSLFDEHYATAEIVKGSPKVNDTVELER